METKKELRKRVLALRDNMPEEIRGQYSSKIAKQIEELSCFRSADAILAYVSFRSEVETEEMTGRAVANGRNVFVPKVCGEQMEFWQIKELGALREGYQGILEPGESLSLPKWLDCERQGGMCRLLMLMPGVAFDRNHNRIGYGKGYYDRYVESLCGKYGGRARRIALTKAGLAFSCQVVEEIPGEAHDVKVDLLITEKGIVTV